MSENKEKNNITAGDLLSRLGKSKTVKPPEKMPDPVEEKEAEEATIIANAESEAKETPDFSAYAEGEPDFSRAAETDGAHGAGDDMFGSFEENIPSADSDLPGISLEQISDEDEAADDYAEYADGYEGYADDMAAEAADEGFDESFAEEEKADLYGSAEPMDESFDESFAEEEEADIYDGAKPADEYPDEYADEYFAQEDSDEMSYGDYSGTHTEAISEENIIPEDEFFDDDPLDDEMFYPADDEPTDDEEDSEAEPDREEEFKNLVEEVSVDSPDSELNENDISLMVALGMEDELAKTVGEETATQITEDYVADQEEWVDRTKRFGAGEYSDPSENAEIAEMYKKRNKTATWKMLAAIALAVGLLFLENLNLIGYKLTGVLDGSVYPVVYIMADLQLVMFGAALVLKNIRRGLKGLFSFRFNVDTIPAIMLCVSVAASAVSAYSAIPGTEPTVFNFSTGLSFVFAAVNEYLTVRREIFSFNIVSSKKPKFVMRNLSTRDAMLESEAIADMDLDSTVADEGDIIKIQETDFVDGYFWRTKNRSTANDGFVGLAIIISLFLAVVVGAYAGITHHAPAFTAGYAALAASLPASMLLVNAYPLYRANRRAYENDCTIIGEGSVEEYSGVGVLSFDDVNVFPSSNVKVRNVRLFNNSRIDKVLYYAASVFATTGGPLADVFEVATMETGHSDNVQILETGTGYIEATVNGKSIIFGRASALSKLGIIIPDDVVSDTAELPADCSVMYMIYQRKLVSKMVVNYVIEPDFEYILKQLTGSGMCVCVKTFDPNIDEEMIYRQMRSGSRYSMRVIKYKNTDEITKYAKHAEGGIVSRGTTKALLHTVSSCDRILSAQKTGYIIGVLSSIFGAAIIGTLLIANSFASLFSLYIVLCQALWLIPTMIIAKLIVR